MVAKQNAEFEAQVASMFQSPRSGKFESNKQSEIIYNYELALSFQSPRSGKFESNKKMSGKSKILIEGKGFQSPRSGKFESNVADYVLETQWAFTA